MAFGKSRMNKKGSGTLFEDEKPRYITRAVGEELSIEHQQFIFNYIHEHKANMNDYFQIFNFYIENDEQWLIQMQEKPNRETTVFVPLKRSVPINRKVWIMDQVDHIIMLFPEDY